MIQSDAKTDASPYHYSSVVNSFKSILKNEGWRAMYKGIVPSLLGVSHVVIQFPIYEYFKFYRIDSQSKF